MIKKLFRTLCIVVMVLCFVGCSKEDTADDSNKNMTGNMNNNEVTEEKTTSDSTTSTSETTVSDVEDNRYVERCELLALSEAGIIYGNTDDGTIHLVTANECNDIVLCYNPNCKHDSSACMAYVGGSIWVMYYDGAIYQFQKTSVSQHKIYKMKPDGSGKELLAKLPFFCLMESFCICKGDKMYYVAWMMDFDEVMNVIDTYKIVEVDLRDGSYRFLTDALDGFIMDATIDGNTLWLRQSGIDDGRVNMITLDIKTGEINTIISKEEYKESHYFIDGYDEDSYIYGDRNTCEIGIRNIDGTVEKILISGAEGERYSTSASGDGILYMRTKAYENEPAGWYFMDITTGEVTNITEEQKKYDFRYYNGQYDAFVKMGSYNLHGIWTRDMIISEAKARQ